MYNVSEPATLSYEEKFWLQWPTEALCFSLDILVFSSN